MVGAVAILLFGGYTRNIRYGLQMGFVRSSGHLQIQHQDYFLYGSGNPAAYGIADYRHVMDLVRPIQCWPHAHRGDPDLQLGGIAGNFEAGVSRTVIAPARMSMVRMRCAMERLRLPRALRTHSLTGTAPNAAVVGEGVARVLQLCGDTGFPAARR